MLRSIVLIFFVQYFCSSFEAPDVKYIVLLDSPIYPHGEGSSDYVDTSDVRVERISETEAVMSGKMKFLKEIGADTILVLNVLKEASGKLETVFSHDICNFCGEIGNENSDYYDMLRHFGFPEECPIDPGEYPIHDFTLDSDQFQLKSQHTGRYEAQLMMYKKTGESCQNDREWMCTMKIDLLVEVA